MSHTGSDTKPLTTWDVEEMCEKKNIPVIENRCWFTVAKAITAFPKSQRNQMTMVEGEGPRGWHVWMEVNGERFDPHFDHIANDRTASDDPHMFTETKKWNGASITFAKGDINSEKRWGMRWNEHSTGHWRTDPGRELTCRDLNWDSLTPSTN